MLSLPVVSVIVPSYNYAHYLPATLQAVLGQTFTDFECLVVEDGSTDNSLELARGFAAQDARVRVLTHPDGKNHGLAASLALALAEARGQWTAFLEADDLWLPYCLEQRLIVAESSTAGVVCNNISPIIMPGANVGWFASYVPRVMHWHNQRQQAGQCTADFAPFLMENKIPTFSCVMVKTGLLRSVCLQTPVARWLDWWVWAQVAAQATCAYTPEKLTRWRLHPKSWNHKVKIFNYINDLSGMGRGFRRMFSRSLAQTGQWGALVFLWLPTCVRLMTRMVYAARGKSVTSTLSRIASRLDLTPSLRKL